jgi:hypothetical protein
MDKRLHWPLSVKNFPASFNLPKPFEIDPAIMKLIYDDRFKAGPLDDPMTHLKKFEKRCETLKISNAINNMSPSDEEPHALVTSKPPGPHHLVTKRDRAPVTDSMKGVRFRG